MKKRRIFDDLISMDTPQMVFDEACRMVAATPVQLDFTVLARVFADLVKLFQGNYPGYRQCNTPYHDLKHTTDCLLAMARLLHGASCSGQLLPARDVVLGLTAALFHDTGYIQTAEDLEGTGAKYTSVHVARSEAFMAKYFYQAGFFPRDLDYCRCCVRCTDLEVKITEIPFESAKAREVGQMLGTADLLGQMADRTYLAKLPFLYQEFQEAHVPGFDSELDLLQKTPAFWDYIQSRLESDLGNVQRYLRDHFLAWFGLNRDLNRERIATNLRQLQFILANHASEYRDYLQQRPGNRHKTPPWPLPMSGSEEKTTLPA
jgi:hypothetical protein